MLQPEFRRIAGRLARQLQPGARQIDLGACGHQRRVSACFTRDCGLYPGRWQCAGAGQRTPCVHPLLHPGGCLDQLAACAGRLRPREQQVGAGKHAGTDAALDIGSQALGRRDPPSCSRFVQPGIRQRPQRLAHPTGHLQPGIGQCRIAFHAFIARQPLAQCPLPGQPQRQPDLEVQFVEPQVPVGTIAAQAGTGGRRGRKQRLRRGLARIDLTSAGTERAYRRVQPGGTVDRGAQRALASGSGRSGRSGRNRRNRRGGRDGRGGPARHGGRHDREGCAQQPGKHGSQRMLHGAEGCIAQPDPAMTRRLQKRNLERSTAGLARPAAESAATAGASILRRT